MSDSRPAKEKKPYEFGGLKEFDIEKIEAEVLKDNVYLDVFAGSDFAFKEDVRPLTQALEKIKKLDGVTFHYKTKEYPEYKFSGERQIGFIAQAVEKVAPELVKKDEAGHLFVNYAQMTPLLLEAVKSLSAQVEQQQKLIDQLLKREGATNKVADEGVQTPNNLN